MAFNSDGEFPRKNTKSATESGGKATREKSFKLQGPDGKPITIPGWLKDKRAYALAVELMSYGFINTLEIQRVLQNRAGVSFSNRRTVTTFIDRMDKEMKDIASLLRHIRTDIPDEATAWAKETAEEASLGDFVKLHSYSLTVSEEEKMSMPECFRDPYQYALFTSLLGMKEVSLQKIANIFDIDDKAILNMKKRLSIDDRIDFAEMLDKIRANEIPDEIKKKAWLEARRIQKNSSTEKSKVETPEAEREIFTSEALIDKITAKLQSMSGLEKRAYVSVGPVSVTIDLSLSTYKKPEIQNGEKKANQPIQMLKTAAVYVGGTGESIPLVPDAFLKSKEVAKLLQNELQNEGSDLWKVLREKFSYIEKIDLYRPDEKEALKNPPADYLRDYKRTLFFSRTVDEVALRKAA